MKCQSPDGTNNTLDQPLLGCSDSPCSMALGLHPSLGLLVCAETAIMAAGSIGAAESLHRASMMIFMYFNNNSFSSEIHSQS